MPNQKLSLEQVLSMDLPNIILYASPVLISLVLIEWVVSYYQKKNYYDGRDTLAATIIGLVNVGISLATKVVVFIIVLFFYNLVPWRIPYTWWSYVLCFIAIDFLRYWAHRVSHETRFWWATHVTHHSSEKYNWSVSFRLGWTQHIKLIFFIPIALAGFHPVVFFICNQLAVLYQFWIHTEYITKLPAPIEYIFVTPSHHRVHHGRNDLYLDKNYGSSLIIWDRLFGTFQPEAQKSEYGLTKPVRSYNPIYLCFHEWRDIIKDIGRSKSFQEALDMTFSKPRDLEEKKLQYKLKEALKKS